MYKHVSTRIITIVLLKVRLTNMNTITKSKLIKYEYYY